MRRRAVFPALVIVSLSCSFSEIGAIPKQRAGADRSDDWEQEISPDGAEVGSDSSEVAELDVEADDVMDVCKDLAGTEKCENLVKTTGCAEDIEWMTENCMLSCGACVEGEDGQKLRMPGDLPLRHEQVVFETKYGQIVLGFFRDAAPITTSHILSLFDLGCYNTNHISQLHRGSFAQIASVADGASEKCKDKALVEKKITGEFADVRHSRGALSMSHFPTDPNSGTSSFSIMLGDAPHMDYHYTVFGRVVDGEDVLKKLEKVSVQWSSSPDLGKSCKALTRKTSR